jgi:hypothetical protein
MKVDARSNESAALRASCLKGHSRVIQLLASHGADVRANSNEAIQSAAARGFASCVSICISLGADVHIGDDAPLRVALMASHIETVDVLLKGGASIEAALGWSKEMWGVIEKHVKEQEAGEPKLVAGSKFKPSSPLCLPALSLEVVPCRSVVVRGIQTDIPNTGTVCESSSVPRQEQARSAENDSMWFDWIQLFTGDRRNTIQKSSQSWIESRLFVR